jgi:hypothetical protein
MDKEAGGWPGICTVPTLVPKVIIDFPRFAALAGPIVPIAEFCKEIPYGVGPTPTYTYLPR